MTSVSAVHDAGFLWLRQSRFDRRYVLKGDDGRAAASVMFDGLVGREATAQCGACRWTLSTDGWLRPVVLMRDLGSGSQTATLTMRWLGWSGRGTLVLSDGRRYQWGPASLIIDRRWRFREAASGDEILSFEKPVVRQTGNTDLLSARLVVPQSATSEPLVALLSVLGMYLLG